MDILLISLAPVAVVAGYVWFRDKYEKEPVWLLLLSLLAGMAIVLPVMVVEGVLAAVGDPLEGIAEAAWSAFAVAGLTEEVFKFIALFLLIWERPAFNDKYDGIVYGTFISLGFAAIENLLYVMQDGYATGLLRAFTAVPAHAIFGITMGFYFGMARFHPEESRAMKWKALVVPIILHGIYDFILFTGIEWLWVVFLAFIVFLYVSGWRRIRHLSDQSYFKTDFELLNRKFTPKNEDS